jgi:hypothetical protein
MSIAASRNNYIDSMNIGLIQTYNLLSFPTTNHPILTLHIFS